MEARRGVRWLLVLMLAFGTISAVACEGEGSPVEIEEDGGGED
jgi:hypothetical protein